MNRLSFISRFAIILGSGLCLSFGIHCQLRFLSGLPVFGDLLPASYLVNAVLAFTIVGLLYIYRKKIKQQIGFLFIGGSFLKFAAFFVFFYPAFKADGSLGRSEFASFFVPYLLALVVETYFTAKLLRELEREEPL